jgi:hypothetical protein
MYKKLNLSKTFQVAKSQSESNREVKKAIVNDDVIEKAILFILGGDELRIVYATLSVENRV